MVLQKGKRQLTQIGQVFEHEKNRNELRDGENGIKDQWMKKNIRNLEKSCAGPTDRHG